MPRIEKADLQLGVDSSAFNLELAKVQKGLEEAFGLVPKQAKSLAQLEIQLKQQAETYGFSATQIKIWKLQQQGVPEAALATVRAFHKQIEALDEAKKKTEASAKAWSDFKSRFGAAAAVEGIKALGSALVDVTSQVYGFAKGQIDLMDQAGDLAGRLGLPVEELTRLQYAFQLTGSEADDVGGVLSKFNINLSDAARKGGPAADALDALGLSAKKLINQPISEQVYQIADAIKGVKNPADRASLAMDIFGKSGVNVINSLVAGGDELRKFANESDALGNTVSQSMVDISGAANDAYDKAWLALGGLGNQLAVAIAPYIISIGDQFTELAKGFGKAGSTFTDVATNIGSVVEVLINIFESLKGVVLGVQTFFTSLGVICAAVLTKIVQGIESVANLIPGVAVDLSSGLSAIWGDLSVLAQEQADGISEAFSSTTGAEVKAWFGSVKSGAESATLAIQGQTDATKQLDLASVDLANKLSAERDSLKAAVATFGMSDEDKKIFDFKNDGATDEQLGPLKALSAQLKVLEQQKKATEELAATQKKANDDLVASAKKYQEVALTPLEKQKKELTEIANLVAKGMLTTDEGIKAVSGIEDIGGDNKPKFAAALSEGSSGARSIILQNQFGGRGGDWQGKLIPTLMDLIKEAKTQNKSLDAIVKKEEKAWTI